MAAIEKTNNLLRVDLPIGHLKKNSDNPNKMSSREFDLLCDNLDKTGLTDAILVRPVDFKATMFTSEMAKGAGEDLATALVEADLEFEIVGGHHRFDAASFLGFEKVPVTIIMDPEFDEEMAKFQLVRMNMIRGKLDPQAFFDLYQKLSEDYTDEVLQDSFGFAEEAEFKRLIDQTAKALPDPHLQKKFKEAAAEIKTIDGLSKLLNEMFTKYGDTLPYGYMIVDHGGQRSMWVRVDSKTMSALDILGTVCIDHQRTIDDVLGGILRSIAKGDLNDFVDGIIAKTPAVEIPENLQVAPTKDNIDKVKSL